MAFHDDSVSLCVSLCVCVRQCILVKMCLPLPMAACLCNYVGVFVCIFIQFVLLLVTTLPSAGLLLPPYIITPKDLKISTAAFDYKWQLHLVLCSVLAELD